MSTNTTRRTSRSTLLAITGISLLWPLTAACSSPDSSRAQESANSFVESAQNFADAVIIDVRTPEEFAEQHLEGALNIDVKSADFVSQIEKLDRNTAYAVYCRSGNRSAQAVKIMKDLGFNSVSDHGSVSEASQSLNISIVS